MRALIQRVSEGGVYIPDINFKSEIGPGMVILVGIKTSDTQNDVNFVADKCSNLRIFEDNDGKMNVGVKESGGEVLVISQFTLYGETSKGNRPGFIDAARPETAIPLYEKFISRMKLNLGENKIKSGKFGEMMTVKIINEGPVTVLVESK
ncbi:MAG: D-aminoacyl-tRNA deacylase [Ignavibacteriaceae bacterium]